MNRPIALSCVQPTGQLHIGHYFGAIQGWVSLQQSHDCLYGIVDLHALTKKWDPTKLSSTTATTALDLMACGISQSAIFVQSLIPEHAELGWILSCISSYGRLTHMPQFKTEWNLVSSSASERSVSVGFFDYPVLQAADILLYDSQIVPIGEDQRQHIELAERLARMFNARFGHTFQIPAPLYAKTPRIMSLSHPNMKMSSTRGPGNFIGLFDEPSTIRAKVTAAVTDIGGPSPTRELSVGVRNLLQILRACGYDQEAAVFEEDCLAGKSHYKSLKDLVSTALIEKMQPIRKQRLELLSQGPDMVQLLNSSSQAIAQRAKRKLLEVREAIGVISRHVVTH